MAVSPQDQQDLLALQSRVARAQRNLMLKAARTDFTSFVRAAVRDEQGKAFQLADIHLAWHRHIVYCWERKLRCGILAPWGHGKSSGMVVPWIAWQIGRNPNLRVKVICNDDGAAGKRVAAVGALIKSDPYTEVFNHVRPSRKAWNAHELYVHRPGTAIDPTLQARGVFTTGIGGRADMEVFDDVVDQKNAHERGVRERLKEIVMQTWLSRLEPTGQVLWIATPWHIDDATYMVMQQAGWCFLIHRVSDDLTCVEQEVIGAGPDYPVAAA